MDILDKIDFVLQEKGSGDKEEYQKVMKALLKKYGVNSPEELSDADKKKFFNELDKKWKSDKEEKGIDESSTDDAKETLQAIIGTLKKRKGKDVEDMLKMANGIMDYYKKEKSFAPDQAKWIFNTSKALFK